MRNQIYCADFVKFAKSVVEQDVDMSITSSPYGDSENGHREYDGFEFDVGKMADALFGITKDGGVCVYVIGDVVRDNSEMGLPFIHANAFMDMGWNLHDTMIFEKSGLPHPSNNRYYQAFDYMFVFSKGKPKTFNALKDRPNSNAGKPAHWGKMTARMKDGSLKEQGKNYITPDFGVRTNIWRYVTGGMGCTADKIAYEHPAIFPEALVRDHILTWTNPGDLVLDPMNGSGTTTKIAKLMKRDFIGVDVSQKYTDIAKARLECGAGNLYLPLTAEEFNTSMLKKVVERDVF